MRAVLPEIGGFFAGLHRGRGVDLRTGVRVLDVTSTDKSVAIDTGDETILADHLVVGIGIMPNVELAAEAGLAVEDGILVDAYGRTADEAIYAAGDVARRYSPRYGRHIRFESWQNAQNSAIVTARNMLGGNEPYDEVPWFWSDQYDVNFQSAGAIQGDDEPVRRTGSSGNAFALFLMQDGKPVGVQAVNFQRDMRWARKLIEQGTDVAPDRLADPAVKLADLVASR
jgi:3-phenylpropionate/trans-cinnamate dioxygenase ferredoxin reductase subunit